MVGVGLPGTRRTQSGVELIETAIRCPLSSYNRNRSQPRDIFHSVFSADRNRYENNALDSGEQMLV